MLCQVGKAQYSPADQCILTSSSWCFGIVLGLVFCWLVGFMFHLGDLVMPVNCDWLEQRRSLLTQVSSLFHLGQRSLCVRSAVTEGTQPVSLQCPGVWQPAGLCPYLPLYHTRQRGTRSAAWVTKSGWEVGKDFPGSGSIMSPV